MAPPCCTRQQVTEQTLAFAHEPHPSAAHGAVAVACVLEQVDDDPQQPRLEARDSSGATPVIR
jgi:hypothetical protein